MTLLPVLALLSACGSSSPATTDETPADTPVAAEIVTDGSFVWVDAQRTVMRFPSGEEATYIGTGGNVIFSSAAMDGNAVVFAVENGGRVELNYVDMQSGASLVMHRHAMPVVYTGTWAPGGQSFAFGFYTPVEGQGRSVIGNGNVMVYQRSTGKTGAVGCSSSQATVAWPSPDTLLVRNNDNLFGVSPTDCRTHFTVDVRKWHHLTPSPDGSMLAYILRDLAYNSATRQYEPDSMLYVAPVGAAEGNLVLGDRYRPRNMAWSSQGSDLAFDALVDDSSDKRAIYIYELATDRRYRLNSASESAPSETDPTWSTDGTRISFTADGEELRLSATGDQFAAAPTLPEGSSRPIRFLGWVSPKSALLQDGSGSQMLYNTATKVAVPLGAGTVVKPGVETPR